MESARIDFFFQGEVVGYLDGSSLPNSPGSYKYVPYRGVGHLRLVKALSSGAQICSYTHKKKAHYFKVSQADVRDLQVVS